MRRRKIFDTEDAAITLKVSQPMIYRYVKAGRLKALWREKPKRGDQLFFDRDEISRFSRPKKGRPQKKGGELKNE